MRRVALDDPAVPDAALVRDVRGGSGDVLARAGMRLSLRSARALRERGVAVAFIEDARCLGVTVHLLVDLAGRDDGLVRALRDVCGVIATETTPLVQQPTTRALATLKEMNVVQKLDKTGAFEGLRAAVQSLVARCRDLDPSTGFLTDRLPADDLLGHSVGVAALSVRIGAELGLSDVDLAWTGLAAVLHDVGLLLVPEEVRRTPAAERTSGQQRRYEDHALLGEAILRPLEKRAPALPLVCAEHHEEQSGGGYPRGLRGGNRVLRNPNAATTSRIALVSEIVALADRYERLVSGAPGVAPLSAAAARRLIAADAGSRLNAEVVGRFLELVPRYPVGTEVILQHGTDAGARGIVVAEGAERDRPVVRLFATPAGTAPINDVTLAEEPGLLREPFEVVAA